MKRSLETAKAVVNLLVLCALAVFILSNVAQASGLVDQEYLDSIVDTNPNPVPHWATPEDKAYIQGLQEERALLPMAIAAAPTGAVWSPGEYEACMGALVAWEPGAFLALLTEFVVGLTTDSSGSIAYVIVRDLSQEESATTTLSGAGANMARVEFIYYNLDSVWIRDYGPRYILVDGMPAIIDHTYNRAFRDADNAFPDSVDDMAVPFEQDEPVHLMDLTHGGGNFHAFSDGNAFMSDLIEEENADKITSVITTIIEDYFDVNLTIYPKLLESVDATGHIDMWFMPLLDDKVLISEFESDHPDSKAKTDAAAAAMVSRGYTVYRVPAYNSTGEGSNFGTHYTYTNLAIVNDRVYFPEFGDTHADADATALAVLQAAMPDHEIVQVDCAAIIGSAGAIHCVMKHVYEPLPAAPTINSTPVTNANVGWLYTYDVYATGYPGSSYSLETYPAGMTIDPDSGIIEWTPSSTGNYDVNVVATNPEGFGTQNFTISVSPAPTLAVYDFYGIESPSGTHNAEGGEIDVDDSMIEDGTFPSRRDESIDGWALWAEATTAEYTSLAGSDDSRYQGADPESGDNAAMIFEFYIAENPADVARVDVSVELSQGAAADASYAYLWNYSTSSYLVLGSQAGTTDQIISASITTNPGDYIDPGTGQTTVFVVNEDVSDWIQVDDISVITYVACDLYDLDCDGSIGFGDVLIMSDNWLDGPDLPSDFYKDDDDIVNFLDFADFANVW